MEEMIKRALLGFDWGNYGLDDVDELATSEGLDVDVFDELAGALTEAVQGYMNGKG